MIVEDHGVRSRQVQARASRLGADEEALDRYLLPYIEQKTIFDTFNLKGNTQLEPHRYTAIPTYLCPSYPGTPVIRNHPVYDWLNGAITTYQGVGGRLFDASGKAYPADSCSAYGNFPRNGIFGYNFVRKIADVSDGLSNTLAMGEFVQKDRGSTGPFNAWPGNCRAWIFGNDGSCGNYAVKVLVHPINAPVDRMNPPYVGYNHLPMGSHHPGGAVFLVGDGSCRYLSESISMTIYLALGSCDGGENEQMPD